MGLLFAVNMNDDAVRVN